MGRHPASGKDHAMARPMVGTWVRCLANPFKHLEKLEWIEKLARAQPEICQSDRAGP